MPIAEIILSIIVVYLSIGFIISLYYAVKEKNMTDLSKTTLLCMLLWPVLFIKGDN